MTEEEIEAKKDIISSHANSKEMGMWNRRRLNLKKIIETELEPIQQEQRDVLAKMQPVLDHIDKIRSEMVDVCVHPKEYLVYHEEDGCFHCKFCEGRLNA